MDPTPDDDPRFTPVMLRRELIKEGYDDRAIARMRADGVWRKVRRGAYAAAADHDRLDESGRHCVLSRAVLKQAKSDAVLSHGAALAWWSAPIWGQDLSAVDLTRRDQRIGRYEAGVRQHAGTLRDGDDIEMGGVPVTSATRTVLDSITVSTTEPGLIVANHFLHAGLTTPKELEDGRIFMERWPGTLNMDVVLRLADPRIESVLESRAFHLFWSQRLPKPEPQYEVCHPNGLVAARVDFAWPDLGVFVECDGRIKYLKYLREGESVTDCILREKAREELVRELTDWRCVRLNWADMDLPQATAARVRAKFRKVVA